MVGRNRRITRFHKSENRNEDYLLGFTELLNLPRFVLLHAVLGEIDVRRVLLNLLLMLRHLFDHHRKVFDVHLVRVFASAVVRLKLLHGLRDTPAKRAEKVNHISSEFFLCKSFQIWYMNNESALERRSLIDLSAPYELVNLLIGWLVDWLPND